MFKNIEDFVNILEVNIENDNFIDTCEDIVKILDKFENSYDAVELILALIEKNPEADFGMPGPLVHFVEKYYKDGYEEKLVDSVKRTPNIHNCFMLNRLINGSEGEEKQVYLSVLDEIINNKYHDNTVLREAARLKDLHNRREMNFGVVMYKVLVRKTEKTVPRVEKLAEKFKDINVTFVLDEVNAETIVDANVVLAWWLDENTLANAKSLERIYAPLTGKNGFPENELARRNIEIINSHAKAKYIAEHGFAILLDITGKVSKTDKIFRTESKWANRSYTDFWSSLFNKKVGFYGFGHIGKVFASFFAPFGCEICTLSRQKERGGADRYFDTLEELAEYCDVLVVTTPLNEATKGSVNLDILKKLGGYVVNVGRGAIIEEMALYTALKENYIMGAASDVWYIYPEGEENVKPSKYPFEDLDNVVMSPHTAWSTFEDADAFLDDIFEKIDLFLSEKFHTL